MTIRKTLLSSVAALGVLLGAATGAAAQQSSAGGGVQVITADARSALSAGFDDAGQAAVGIELESHTPHAPGFGTPETMFSPPRNAEEGAALRASASSAVTLPPSSSRASSTMVRHREDSETRRTARGAIARGRTRSASPFALTDG